MSKLVIIGKGPAGISAALYATRSRADVLVIGKDNGALKKGGNIENYYGFPNGIDGNELVNLGIKQAQELGIDLIEDEVLDVSYNGEFNIKTKDSTYKASSVILSTGISRISLKIERIREFEGKGVSYCATCDAFFYRDKNVVVIGNSEYAINEATELSFIAKEVTILTNGLDIDGNLPSNVKLNKTKISKILGITKVEGILFEGGSSLMTDGIFIAIGTASASDIGRKLGLILDGKKIKVGDNQETNIPGLYAAGDCTGGILQIAEAIYEGAKAGMAAAKYIRKKEND